MTQDYGRLTPGQGVFPLYAPLNDPLPAPPATEKPPVVAPKPQMPQAPVAPAPAYTPSKTKVPQSDPNQTYGFKFSPTAGWNNDFMTVYNQIKSGALPKDAMRFTNPRTEYEANLYDFILYGTPMPFAEGGEVLAGAESESGVGGGLEQVIDEPAKIVGIKSGKVYATVSEHAPEIIKIIPLDEAQGAGGPPMPPQASQMGNSAPAMNMMGGAPPMPMMGAGGPPAPQMPGMEVPGYATGGELLAMGYDPNDPAVQAAIRSGSLNYSTPVQNVQQAAPQAKVQPYSPMNSQPLYQESQQHSMAPSPLVPVAQRAQQNFVPQQQAPTQQYPQAVSATTDPNGDPNYWDGSKWVDSRTGNTMVPVDAGGDGIWRNPQGGTYNEAAGTWTTNNVATATGSNSLYQGGTGPFGSTPIPNANYDPNAIQPIPNVTPGSDPMANMQPLSAAGGAIPQPQVPSQSLTDQFNALIANAAQMAPNDSQDFNILYQSLQNQVQMGMATEAEAVDAFRNIVSSSAYGNYLVANEPMGGAPAGAPGTAVPPPIQTGGRGAVAPAPSMAGTAGGPNQASMPQAAPIGPMAIPDVVHGGTANLSPDIVQAIQAVFPPQEFTTAYYIVAAESKGNPQAVGAAGEVGLFQIHPVNWSGLTRILGTPINAQTLKDPFINAQAAKVIWEGAQGWGRVSGNPWATAPGVFAFFSGGQ